jgi:sec-independent protein translocase protein TatC
MVTPDISSFLSFALAIFFAFGIAFEIPIAVFILIWTGIVEPDDLVEKRPYVIVTCFVIGMLLTPPDPFSQTILARPMWMLFEVGIFFGRFATKRAADREKAESGADA